MILNTAENIETNCQLKEQTFKITPSPIAFEILSNKLYSNPQLAIVRELLTNAYDSHKLANNLETPIKIHFPTDLDNNFIIRDYGVGLSKEDVMNLYTTFFASTKNTTNDFTGCFGLGSKTPFSYTSSFSINSYYNGIKYSYLALKKDGLPSIIFVNEEITEEPNGLEISIPSVCNTTFDNSFLVNTRNYIRFIPEMKIKCNENISLFRPNILFEEDNIKIYDYNYFLHYYNLQIKQGQNTYTINFYDKINDIQKLQYFIKTSKKYTIVVEVPIGTLDITPNREELIESKNNVNKVNDILVSIEEKLKKLYTTNIETTKKLDENIYTEILTEKYFKKQECSLNLYEDNLILSLPYYFNTKNYNAEYKEQNIYLDKTKYFIIASNKFNNQDSRKITNICNNYFNEIDKNVTIIIPNKYEYKLEEIKQKIQQIKDIVNICNNIEEYPEISIQFITLPRFYKLYPNNKKTIQKKYPDNYYNNKSIKCKRYTISLDNGNISQKGNGLYRLNKLYDLYDPYSTLIVDFSFPESYITELAMFVTKIKDKKGNNFLLNYLQKKKKLYLNTSSCFLDILFVAKSNIRHFKNYSKLKEKEFRNVINNNDWNVKNIDTNRIDYNINKLEKSKIVFKDNFKGKCKKYIENTSNYKKIDLLINYYKKILDNTATRFSNSEQLLLTTKYKNKIINGLCQYNLPNNLNIIINSIFSTLLLNNTKNKLNNKTISYYKLSNKEKNQVLKLLRGDYYA